jgi:hypothetical protein
MYAFNAPASLPFYRTDGTTLTEYTTHSNYTKDKIVDIEHVFSNGLNFIMTTLGDDDSQGSKLCSIVCTCLETGTSVHLRINSLFNPNVVAYKDLFVIGDVTQTGAEILRYDPYTNVLETIDSFDDSTRRGNSLSGSYFYQHATFVKRYYIESNMTKVVSTNITMSQAIAVPTKAEPDRYLLTSIADTSALCTTDESCTIMPFSPIRYFSAYIPHENRFIYKPLGPFKSLISFSLDSLQRRASAKLRMETTRKNSVIMFMNFAYQNLTNTLFFTGVELDGTYAIRINLFKMDVNTEKVIELTSLCSGTCPNGLLIHSITDTVTVLQLTNGEFHLYEVVVAHDSRKTTLSAYSASSRVKSVAIITSTLFGTAVVVLLVVFIGVYLLRKRQPERQYELVTT